MTTPAVPPLPHPDPPASPSDVQTLQQALAYARGLATEELARIDRLHNRTMMYIGVFVAVILGGFIVFGWIGYTNLRDSVTTKATATAGEAMKDEIKKQVSENLKADKVAEIVRTQVKDVTEAEARAQLQQEIEKGPLRTEILDTAKKQSQELLMENLGQRDLSPEDEKKIMDAIKADPFLSNKKNTIVIGYAQHSEEAFSYSEKIKNAIHNAGVYTRQGPGSFADQTVASEYGVLISSRLDYVTRTPREYAVALQSALHAGGIESIISDKVFWTSDIYGISERSQMVYLYVGNIRRPTYKKK